MREFDLHMKKAVADAHVAALQDFKNGLRQSLQTIDINKAYPRYKIIFIESLLKVFYPPDKTDGNVSTVNFKPILDRLAQKGAEDHWISTNPLCLTAILNNAKMTFKQDYHYQLVSVDDYEIKVSRWEANIVDILEAIHLNCQEEEIEKRLNTCFFDYKREIMREDIMNTTVKAIVKERLREEEYKIMGQGATWWGGVWINIETKPGPLSVISKLENFNEELDFAIERRDKWVTKRHK